MDTHIAVIPDTQTIFIVVSDRDEFNALPFSATIGERVDTKVTDANDGYVIVFQCWHDDEVIDA